MITLVMHVSSYIVYVLLCFLSSGVLYRFLYIRKHLEFRILKSLFFITLIMPKLTKFQRAPIVDLLDIPAQRAAAIAQSCGVAAKSTVNRLR